MPALTRHSQTLMPPPFNPTSLTPYKWHASEGPFWQNTARTTPATADGDPIATWDDISGNGHHYVQATAGLRPILKKSIVNGRDIVRTDGVDDYMQDVGLTGVAAMTWFWVVKKRAAPTSTYQNAMAVDASLQLGTDTDVGTGWVYTQNQAAAPVSVGGVATNFSILCMTWASASSVTVRVGGGAGTTFDPANSYASVGEMYFGGNPTFDGDYAENIRWQNALAITDLNNVGNYLAAKFACPWALA